MRRRKVGLEMLRLGGSSSGFGEPRSFPLDFSEKAITAPRERLDKTRAAGRITQDFPNLVHSCVQTVIKINESISRPQLFAQLLASNNAPRALQQKDENGKRLVLKPEPSPLLTKFPRFQISLKDSEAGNGRAGFLNGHGR